jgi:hypothetical protein
LERLCKAIPEIRDRVRIVKQVAGTNHRIYRVAACDIEHPANHCHASARQLLLTFFGKGWKASPKVPVGSMQQF